ncbi:MAG TPA: alpha/beta fold hydrolase [Solirubrobacteraceae bacterium]|nr:alpha/beta fold hydrolase [Solirubrobacteraceae bacterium]
MPEAVVLLHGFGGTRHTWDGVAARLDAERYRPLAIDLPGHGDAAGERPITFASCVARVLAEAPARFTLCGYSMGGRIALHAALAAPQRVARLVLVSSHAGVEDALARHERRRADHALAAELESVPLDRFTERWSAQPLFAEDPPEVKRLAREEQRRNRPEALAAALRGVGAGEMQPLWGRLGELAMPVDVLVGERDATYQALGRELVARLPRGRLRLLAGGHRLALESPAELAGALEDGDA